MMHVVAVMPITRKAVAAIRRGDFYLVDVGALVRVTAASPRAAVQIANSQNLGPQECCAAHPTVYQLDADGQAVAIFND